MITEEDKKQKPNAALIAAAKAGDEEAVRRCLRDGADPNAADGDGQTALIHATMKNQVGCMEALAEAGPDLDKAGVGGVTPLIQTVYDGHTAAVEWLLGRGADWRLADYDGKTALDLAKMFNKAEAAAALEAWIAEHGSGEPEPEP